MKHPNGSKGRTSMPKSGFFCGRATTLAPIAKAVSVLHKFKTRTVSPLNVFITAREADERIPHSTDGSLSNNTIPVNESLMSKYFHDLLHLLKSSHFFFDCANKRLCVKIKSQETGTVAWSSNLRDVRSCAQRPRLAAVAHLEFSECSGRSGVSYFKTPRGRAEPWQQTDVSGRHT